MKRVKRSHATAWVIVLAMLACAGAGKYGGGPSRAGVKLKRARAVSTAKKSEEPQPASRVSPDLLELARDPGAQDGRVRVILQSDGAADPALASLLRRRDVKTSGQFNTVGARAVELPARLVEQLAEQKGVRFVSLDRETVSFGHVSETTGTDDVRAAFGTNVNGLDGNGIGIAILDSGIDTGHTAFRDERSNQLRVVYSKDFTGEGRTDDPYGHGTHVASIAAGNGRISNGSYIGIAPDANILNLRVLDKKGTGRVSNILSALEWVFQNRALYNIRVVNLSLGAPAVESYRDDPVCRAVRKLVDAGIVVAAAAGNLGKDASGQKIYGAIHSPGDEPSAITVGASNTFGTDQRSDDTVTSYSSRGPTRGYRTDLLGVKHHDNLIKPDLVAPGNKIIDAAAIDNYLIETYPSLDAGVSNADKRRMMYMNGSSMATPVIAGAAALMLQANPRLTPNLVKTILMYTAQPLANNNMLEQGAGEVNVEGAVRLARLVRADLSPLTPLGAPLLTAALPLQQSTIAGETFAWARGVVIGSGFATGQELITAYQKIYGLGMLINDGVLVTDGMVMSDGVLVTDRTMLSDGVLVTDHVEVSSGGVMGSGSVYLSTGVLVTDNFYAGDGVLVTDNIMAADAAQAMSATTEGDAAPLMPRPADASRDYAVPKKLNADRLNADRRK